MVKRAYAEGAFVALQQLGYEKTAAAQIAIKMAEEEMEEAAPERSHPGRRAGQIAGGAGLGALGGAGLGAGGAALASLLLKKNLMRSIPGLGSKVQGLGAAARRTRGDGALSSLKKLLGRVEANPTAASAVGGGLGGAGLGALGGGLYGGLSD